MSRPTTVVSQSNGTTGGGNGTIAVSYEEEHIIPVPADEFHPNWFIPKVHVPQIPHQVAHPNHHHQQQQTNQHATTGHVSSGTTVRCHEYVQQPPRLLLPLLQALSSLYGIQPLPIQPQPLTPLHPLLSPSTNESSHQNVHSFLLWIQSRNIRRQVQSLHQQYVDSSPPSSSLSSTSTMISNPHHNHTTTTVTANDHHHFNNSHTTSEIIYMGSSWLACLVILVHHCDTIVASTGVETTSSSSQPSPPQPLFAIQTMLHRIRRVKLTEAIDIEIEEWSDTNQKMQLLQQYSVVMDHDDHPAFRSALGHWYMRHLQPSSQQPSHQTFLTKVMVAVIPEMVIVARQAQSEEQIKAELSLTTCAILIYVMAYQQVKDDVARCHGTTSTHNDTIHRNAVTPLLSMTISTLVTIVFRWWYTTTATTTTTTTSIVSMIQDTYRQVQARLIQYQQSNRHDDDDSSNTMFSRISTETSNAWSVALLCTIAAIPDAILASPGGARGRLSIDPRAIQMGSAALRQLDTKDFATILLNEYNTYHHHHHHSSTNAQFIDRYIMYACERWVTYLPLDHTILSVIEPYLQSTNRHTLPLLIAIYESATWTIDQIISSYIGLSSSDQQQQQQQQNKKKQSSRSKKRHKEIVDSHSTDQLRYDAMAEMQLRGDIAYHITIHCWNHLSQMNQEAMEQLHLQQTSSQNIPVEGEGPIGCMTACANACLPHIVRYPIIVHGSELFYNISQQIQQICRSPDKSIRALSYEPLYTLHAVLVDVWSEDAESKSQSDTSVVENVVVDHFFHCAINLASVCNYPTTYFDHLCAESDHDLEIERNDVRDLLRTVSGCTNESTVGFSDYPSDVSIQILSRLVASCKDSIFNTQQRQGVLSETVIHAFSALAKPINHLSKCYVQQQRASTTNANATAITTTRHILLTVLQVLLEVNRFVVDAFQQLSLSSQLLLPISRTVNIGNSSFAPCLAALSSIPDVDMTDGVQNVLDRIILGSIFSLEEIPELAGPSILEHSMYDIRGTMRGPGGEDHVGCLTLMRYANEDHTLASRMIVSSSPYIGRLCELHQTLKQIEVDRGPTVFHGRGVTPQTRRILLGSLCHLEVLSQGQLGASSMLNQLFIVAIESIAQYHSSMSNVSNVSQIDFFRINESTMDIVAFTPTIITTLFDSNEPRYSHCLEVVTSAFVNGYHMLHNIGSILQWNRQRASLFALIKKSAQSTNDISDRATKIIIACGTAECDAINRQCMNGPFSTSPIFTEEVVSPESIPAGLMVKALADVISLSSNIHIVTDNHTVPFRNCLRTLTTMKDTVLTTILLTCPDPHCNPGAFNDPRPTVAEAWFQAMIALATYLLTNQSSIRTDDKFEVEVLLMETFVATISLFFYSSLGKTTSDRAQDAGMSLDGPHGLAIMSFFISYFRLPPRMLQLAGERLYATVPVNLASFGSTDGDSKFVGVAIVGAALFRVCQGALPPWAIESVPEVYCSLFESGFGSDAEAFCRWMQLSMELRLNLSIETNSAFSGLAVSSGQLLSGRHFEGLSAQAKLAFVTEAKQLAVAGGGASWRRLKGLIKQICGGKKKDSDFNQKPSPTRWEFDRV